MENKEFTGNEDLQLENGMKSFEDFEGKSTSSVDDDIEDIFASIDENGEESNASDASEASIDENDEDSIEYFVDGDEGHCEEDEEENENAKVIDKDGYSKKRLLAVGLACLVVGGICGAAFRGCSKSKQDSNDTNSSISTVIDDKENSLTNGATGETNIEDIKDEQLKIEYITMDDYTMGVKKLCKHFNDDLGFKYEPSSLTSLYYFANMELIPNSLFQQLIQEGFIPDTDVAILTNVFAITSDLKTKIGQDGFSDIDFEVLFANPNMVQVAENWETKFNTLKGASNETVKKVMEELEEFVVVTPEQGYNALPTGGKDIFNWVIADSIGIRAGVTGIAPSDAFTTEISDITTAITLLGDSLKCMEQPQSEKKLTK